MPINWLYGTAISGIQFPLITASGTLAKGYNTATLSGVISKDGGAWAALNGRISGIPGDGWYNLVSLSSTEMTCYTWSVKVTANSGCLDQGIVGINMSGYATAVDVSGIGNLYISVSGLPGILANTSSLMVTGSGHALTAQVSGLPQITINTSGLALKSDVSSLPELWISNSGHALRIDVSALAATYIATSGLDNIYKAISGFDKILVAVSGVAIASASSVAGIQTTDATVLASGTLPHDIRLARWHTWEKTVVDKRPTPARQHYWNGTNTSTFFEISDDSDTASRVRGG
jgi:hypothetical protein